MNLLVMSGFVGSPPEIKEYGEGKKFAVISLAVSAFSSEKDEEKKTEWFRFAYFAPAVVHYIENSIQKGCRVQCTGKLQENIYEKNGEKIYAMRIIGQSIGILSPPKDFANTPGNTASYSGDKRSVEEFIDDNFAVKSKTKVDPKDKDDIPF